MYFELTEALTDQIIFSMENQDEMSVLDAKNLKIISVEDEVVLEDTIDEENIYTLPVWTSNDGFNLLEEFVSTVRIKVVHDELRRVLSNGRGVFRNFKNVLKLYPEVDKRFHAFKNKKMREFVYEWYNMLRESWGLEKLGQDFEDFDELTQEDFTFRQYDSLKDRISVAGMAGNIADEIKAFYADEPGLVVSDLWKQRFEKYFSENGPGSVNGFVCRTLEDEFAGCLLFSFCQSYAKETVVLTACFVDQNYRGLGIARELFADCISYLKNHDVHWFIIEQSALPSYLEPLLNRYGFEKKGSVYVADFQKID